MSTAVGLLDPSLKIDKNAATDQTHVIFEEDENSFRNNLKSNRDHSNDSLMSSSLDCSLQNAKHNKGNEGKVNLVIPNGLISGGSKSKQSSSQNLKIY